MQGTPEGSSNIRVAAARHLRRRDDDLEAVRCAGVDVKLGRDPRLEQAGGVRDALVAEQVGPADGDERGREAGQIGGPGRGGVTGHPGPAGIRTEVGAPAERVRRSAPYRGAVQLARRRDLPVVEHGIDQDLMGQRRPPAVPGEQRDRGR
jgi:hypothetical protein